MELVVLALLSNICINVHIVATNFMLIFPYVLYKNDHDKLTFFSTQENILQENVIFLVVEFVGICI